MNYTLNIEIKTPHNLETKNELITALKENISTDFLKSIKLTNKLKSAIHEDVAPSLRRTIQLILDVPIELDECGRRKSPTCTLAKYLDKCIEKLQYGHISCESVPEYSQKSIDLATLPMVKYNEKYKTYIPESDVAAGKRH